MDENDLARFLERTLSEEEHGRAVAHLSASDEDAEVLGDAAYLLREMDPQGGVPADEDEADAAAGAAPAADVESPDGGARVIPLRPPSTQRPRRRVPAQWMALAAVLAGVLLVPLALSRRGGDYGDYAALLANREAGLDSGWIDQPPWGGKRGSDSAVDRALAARLGALHVDLEVAVAARQVEETGLLVGKIRDMLAGVTAAGSVSSIYREIGERAGEPPEALAELLAEGRKNVSLFVDADYFSLGAWAEAARIAADMQDPGFFRARASRRMLDHAASLDSLDEEARNSVQAIRTAVEPDGEPDWTSLVSHTSRLLEKIGR